MIKLQYAESKVQGCDQKWLRVNGYVGQRYAMEAREQRAPWMVPSTQPFGTPIVWDFGNFGGLRCGIWNNVYAKSIRSMATAETCTYMISAFKLELETIGSKNFR